MERKTDHFQIQTDFGTFIDVIEYTSFASGDAGEPPESEKQPVKRYETIDGDEVYFVPPEEFVIADTSFRCRRVN